ncbi:DJ-1/PfpI family protein [Saccharopolyspora erythraea NRRL 2338]|uniref:ThiJ/PfpI n=2 Tax=Saccharopolyspora erythraea TaxID=1836 RepID=A4FHL3_SACEN|nr:DJ-1/PfpI family protein [Saccharopolyspora erythraea]EQD81824.1 glutamine amidotransferase [Saccharopolyspora erythraea D]PFG97228.1 DJ-1/PfpI family protein [Saccharopolyspora erythraea NRRL 2338]QRK87424.1 DJ-1/PfpI family protein [Saccharopolyspora erythraea]CAM03538.1 ThiJ/PfpI [Saccharopolyspora erythraea NRRL 2338]
MFAQIVLFDGFDPLDVVAPYEVLSAGGNAAGGALEVELVSAEGAREVPSGVGALSLRATARLDPGRGGLLVVPGAAGRLEGDGDDTVVAVLRRALGTELPVLLREAVDRSGLVVSTVCGGSLLLAMAGLIQGRRATTHHLGLDELAAAGVTAIKARVVDDGDLVTGAGVTSGLDLGLHLLERELGPRVALAVEELFAHERRGTAWRDAGAAAVPLAAEGAGAVA